jgi:hypothetical protein
MDRDQFARQKSQKQCARDCGQTKQRTDRKAKGSMRAQRKRDNEQQANLVARDALELVVIETQSCTNKHKPAIDLSGAASRRTNNDLETKRRQGTTAERNRHSSKEGPDATANV